MLQTEELFHSLFVSTDAVREVIFGLIFTLVAFYIGRESGRRRERQLQRNFLHQLVQLQGSIHDLANNDAFWVGNDFRRSDLEIVFLPLDTLMRGYQVAAGNSDIADRLNILPGKMDKYEATYVDFKNKWLDAERRGKSYRSANNEMINALQGVLDCFSWFVRWGFSGQLKAMKLARA